MVPTLDRGVTRSGDGKMEVTYGEGKATIYQGEVQLMEPTVCRGGRILQGVPEVLKHFCFCGLRSTVAKVLIKVSEALN